MTQVYIHTAGCSLNIADSEQMAGLLKQAQFVLTDRMEEAHVFIFNTCSVKGPTERAFFSLLEETKAKYPYKIIIVTGCIPQTDPEKLEEYPLVGTRQIHRIVEVVEEALHDNKIQLLDSGEAPPLNLPRVRRNPVVGIIPISRGCLGACSYCKTKAARGHLVSYSIEEIKKEAEQALKEGVKELWLTSQDTSCYGFDRETNLAQLLKEISPLAGEFKIRVGMMNPDNLLKIKNEFMEAFADPKIFKFIHLPVQSGNNEILKKMRRNYTVEEFKVLVRELREKFPTLTLATDIIVGFPGESEEQYWDTQNLVREIMPEVINLSKFWPRPKTPAAALTRLPGEMVKHRSTILTGIYHNIARMRNERWLGWEGEVIIDEKSKEPNQMIGRNESYKPVVLEGEYPLGQVLKVRILRTTTFDLRGIVLK